MRSRASPRCTSRRAQTPRPTGWIDIRTAAQRSGRDEAHLRRLCLSKWSAAGQAEKRPSPAGGKAHWWIREDADAAFARVKYPEQLSAEFDLRTLTTQQQQTVLRRKRILDGWRTALESGRKLGGFSDIQITGHYLAQQEIQEQTQVSRRTLYNWEQAYRRDGLAGLVDGRGQSVAPPAADDPFFEFLQRIYLTPRQLSISACVL
jgi:hypothetical protein